MKGRTLIITVMLAMVSGGAVFVLYVSADSLHRQRDFFRVIRHDIVFKSNVLKVERNYYPAGATSTRLYFANRIDPADILETDLLLQHQKRIRITFIGANRPNFEMPALQVDAPFFFLKDGNLPGIFTGTIGHWQARQVFQHKPWFTQAVAISPASFVIQGTFSPAGGKDVNMIGKIMTDPPGVHLQPDLLDHANTYYATTGTLRYNERAHRLVYTYFYSSKFIVMDTMLKVIRRGQTIDGSVTPEIKQVAMAQDRFTMGSPAIIINRNAQTDGAWLFIESNAVSKNERSKEDHEATVIDVYALSTGQYQFSFYIPDHEGKKMQAFLMHNDLLVAVFEDCIVTFHLNLPRRE